MFVNHNFKQCIFIIDLLMAKMEQVSKTHI